jgi:hypothetical protein
MKIYNPYPGKGVLWGLVLLLTLIGTFSIVSYFMYKDTGEFWPALIMVAVSLLTAGIIGYYTFVAQTLKYKIMDRQLVIEYGFSKKVIDLEQIGNLKTIKGGMKAFKLAGVGWPGLHMGLYNIGKDRNINLYTTRIYGEMIIFKHRWETLGITPENPQEFIEDIKKIIPDLEAKEVDPQQVLAEKLAAEQENSKLFRNLSIVNFTLLLLTYLWVGLIIPTLPDQIPMHIGPDGVDNYGSPRELFILPLINTITFLIMYLVARKNRSSSTALYSLMILPIFLTVIMNLAVIIIINS